MVVYIAIYSPNRCQFSQSINNIEGAYITGMPYFISVARIFQNCLIYMGMGIRK